MLHLRLKKKNSTVFTVEDPYGSFLSTSIHPDRVDDDNPAMRNLSRVETFYPTLQTLYNKYGLVKKEICRRGLRTVPIGKTYRSMNEKLQKHWVLQRKCGIKVHGQEDWTQSIGIC